MTSGITYRQIFLKIVTNIYHHKTQLLANFSKNCYSNVVFIKLSSFFPSLSLLGFEPIKSARDKIWNTSRSKMNCFSSNYLWFESHTCIKQRTIDPLSRSTSSKNFDTFRNYGKSIYIFQYFGVFGSGYRLNHRS